jgi:hypothetical protein
MVTELKARCQMMTVRHTCRWRRCDEWAGKPVTNLDNAKSGSGILTASAGAVMHQQEPLAGVHCDESLTTERDWADCAAESLRQNLCICDLQL